MSRLDKRVRERDHVKRFTRRGVARVALEMARQQDGLSTVGNRRITVETNPIAAEMLRNKKIGDIERIAKENSF